MKEKNVGPNQIIHVVNTLVMLFLMMELNGEPKMANGVVFQVAVIQ